MRLFVWEIRKILKPRRTRLLLAAAFLMAAITAYLPVSFESINRPGEQGSVVELNGLEAIRFKQGYYKETAGEMTGQRLADMLRTYQSYVQKYGTLDDIPLDVYIERIMAVRPAINRLAECFADSKTGMALDVMAIDPEEVEQHFYEKCVSHLDDIMALEQKEHPAAGRFAAGQYSGVTTPFWQYFGISRDAFDYTTLYLLVLSILCTAIAAPVFANEYQTGSDSILRCTKYGRMHLAVLRILAACTVCIAVFLPGMALHLSILNLAFGTDCLRTSVQMLFSVISLTDLDLGQLQMVLVLAGLLSILSVVSFTLYLSARCRDSLTVLLLSMVILLFPAFASGAFGGHTWLTALLPSAGIGMQNSFLYQVCDLYFLHAGSASFWTPYVILVSAAAEIPVFLFLAVRSYCRHQVG